MRTKEIRSIFFVIGIKKIKKAGKECVVEEKKKKKIQKKKKKKRKLTKKTPLEGDKGEDSSSKLYGKKSQKEGIRTINYPLPPHLTFGNPKKDSEGNTLYYSNDGKLKQEAQEFFISLNRRKNRLRRAIDSLGDDI